MNEKYNEYIKKNINFPKECPSCHGPIEVTDNGFVKCINPSCKQKIVHKFVEALRILGVDGAGESMLESFINSGIGTVKELLTSHAKMRAMGANESKVSNAISAACAKPITMSQFIAMFDLDGFSEKKLGGLETYSGMASFYEDPIGTLTNICEISAENRAIDFIAGFASYDVKLKLFTELYAKVREMTITAPFLVFKKNDNGALNGMSFCFTGSMQYRRGDLENAVTSNGGCVKSSVTKGLSYLVQADPSSNSTKSKKARELGTEIISPEQFLNILYAKGINTTF